MNTCKIFGKFVLIVNQSTSSTLVACTISIAIMYHTIEGNHSMLLNSALSSVMHRCSTQWSKTRKIEYGFNSWGKGAILPLNKQTNNELIKYEDWFNRSLGQLSSSHFRHELLHSNDMKQRQLRSELARPLQNEQ